MKYINLYSIITFCLLVLGGCQPKLKLTKATDYNFPQPKDTYTKPVQIQTKKTYAFSAEDVYASNEFDGARLNNFTKVEANRFKATISPENTPINPSPHYAFKLWSKSPKRIKVKLHYTAGKHRYRPKISTDRKNWKPLGRKNWKYTEDSIHVELSLKVSPDTLWVAAQEIKNSTDVREWCQQQAQHPAATLSVVGKSKLGRDLYFLDIGKGKKKNALVIFSRQHPPEVSGYLAMEAFIEEILSDARLSKDFIQKFRIFVFPLMNPDGVDLGHWRHNAGGIDLNRDWAFYRQPETRQVADFIVKTVQTDKNKVLLGLDFHSTYRDVYYTADETIPSSLTNFEYYWLKGVGDALPNYTPNIDPSGLTIPTSKGWLYTQFKAEAVTYEIGDETKRDFIRLKGKVSAIELMKLLILK